MTTRARSLLFVGVSIAAFAVFVTLELIAVPVIERHQGGVGAWVVALIAVVPGVVAGLAVRRAMQPMRDRIRQDRDNAPSGS